MAETAPRRTTRGERFAARLRGEELPEFAAVMRGRRVGGEREGLAEIAALLAARPAIDAMVNGAQLARLAEAVGEERFDLICVADVAWYDQSEARAPPVNELAQRGGQLLDRAATSAQLARLVELAVEIQRSCLNTEMAA